MAINNSFDDLFEEIGRRRNVHPSLLKTVFHLESGGNPDSRDSAQGAQGGMQIMPGTARMLGVNPKKFEEAVDGAARYLREGLDVTGTGEGALAYYHAGPDRRGWGPKTAAYVAKGQGLFPSMAVNVADKKDDGDVLSRWLKGGVNDTAKAPASDAKGEDDVVKRWLAPAADAAPAPAAPMPNPVSTAPAQNPDNPGEMMEVPTGPASVPQFPPGTPPVMQRLRNALAPNPDAGEVLPLAGDMSKGTLRPAVPNSILSFGRGVIDLLEGPTTGTVSPEGTMALTMGVGGPGMSSVARGTGARIAGNRLAPAAVPDALPAPSGVPEFLPPGARTPEPVAPVPAPAPDFMPPSARGPASAPAPNSVGAAATPQAAATMTRNEARAAQSTAEYQKLIERQPMEIDAKVYVPGVQTTEAQMVQHARVSRNEKLLEANMPAQYKAIREANDQVRKNALQDLAGTATLAEHLNAERAAFAESAVGKDGYVWRSKTQADPAPVLEAAQAILAGPEGRSEAVEKSVKSVVGRMMDKDGKPFTDPAMLYGVRKHIDHLLDKGGTAEGADARLAKSQLVALKDALTDVIKPAAPGFGEYLTKYQEMSAPYDEMVALQKASRGVLSAPGQMTYSSFQRMMRDLQLQRQSRGIEPAQSISPEKMEMLWNIRDDLRRVASSDDLAKARGSDTFSLFNDMAKKGVEAGVHGVANYFAPVLGSAVVTSAKNKLMEGKMLRDVARSTNPDVNKLRRPND